jgi:hypothetical protein
MEWMIAVGFVCGALAAFGGLIIVLDVLWHLSNDGPAPPEFPRARLLVRRPRA